MGTADFNGDLRPDLAVANIDGTVSLFLGQPEARFSAPIICRLAPMNCVALSRPI